MQISKLIQFVNSNFTIFHLYETEIKQIFVELYIYLFFLNQLFWKYNLPELDIMIYYYSYQFTLQRLMVSKHRLGINKITSRTLLPPTLRYLLLSTGESSRIRSCVEMFTSSSILWASHFGLSSEYINYHFPNTGFNLKVIVKILNKN